MLIAKYSPCFLFDNGSLRPEATLGLRAVASALAERIGTTVHPVSLLHSSWIDPAALAGRPAELLEPALDRFLAEGGREGVLVPLFFGPSAALTDYVPERLRALQARHPQARLATAGWLVRAEEPDDTRIARGLADQVRALQRAAGLGPVPVLLVDHGTPQRAVTAVRERLGQQVRAELGNEIHCLGTASMERRDGPEYAFNEPLLEQALARGPYNRGTVIIALQFLAPGRHAGAAGDIATICAQAEARQPELRTRMTATLGAHPLLIEVLTDRYHAAMGSLRSG